MRQEINISSPDKIEMKIDFGVLKDQASMAGIDDAEGACKQGMSSTGVSGDFKQESYQDDRYIGCKMSGTMAPSSTKFLSYDEASKRWTFHISGSSLGEGTSSQVGTLSESMFTDFEVKVTFPGKVLTASGDGQISGNTVTWSSAKDLLSSDGLMATAENDPDLTWLWITMAVVVVAGVVVTFLLIRRGRTCRAASRPRCPVEWPRSARSAGRIPESAPATWVSAARIPAGSVWLSTGQPAGSVWLLAGSAWIATSAGSAWLSAAWPAGTEPVAASW